MAIPEQHEHCCFGIINLLSGTFALRTSFARRLRFRITYKTVMGCQFELEITKLDYWAVTDDRA